MGLSLERSLSLAEAMEARGYGGAVAHPHRRSPALNGPERVLTRDRAIVDLRRGRHGASRSTATATTTCWAIRSRRSAWPRPRWSAWPGRRRRDGALGGRRDGQALSFDDVRYRYPDAASPPLTASRWTSSEGELVLLLGESGCGKSTLLRAALGLVPHFHGGELAGRVVSDGPGHARAPPARWRAQRAGWCSRIPSRSW